MAEISLIRKIDKESIAKIIFFSKNLSIEDSNFLKDEFEFNSNHVNYVLDGYRDIGLVFNLKGESELNDWSSFISKIIPKNDMLTKFDSVFVGKNFDKLLLLTTKRLLKIDLEKLNEKIDMINESIHRHNIKFEREKKSIEHELKELDKLM